ncbi:MAG TPA: hypothetical protein DIU00_23450 [Phycisphaerales bacterium]|mgnify:CR=1 FL=1|nr:hypothetical protein [Phycisphaerales bacterium]
MTRNRGKKALYEVMSKARVKPDQGTIVEHLRPRKPDKEAPSARQKGSAGAPKTAAKWWKKPSIVQFNAGRFEFSMPYQVAVVLLLVFIFVILAAYRFGQNSYPAGQHETDQQDAAAQEMDDQTPLEQAIVDVMPPYPQPENSENMANMTARTEVAEPVKPMGNNVIVLVQYDSLPDLAPVQQHFSEYGIETEIVTEMGRYFLQTKERYDNPATPGTDGYKAIQKIIEVGKKYKAPAGYDSFATHYFSDAYGKKVN